MLPPLVLLLLLFILMGMGLIYLAYYVFVKFGTSFKNNPFFIKFSTFVAVFMLAGAITWFNDPILAYKIFGLGGVGLAVYMTYFFKFTVKGSYNLKIFRLERDIEKLEFERKKLLKKLNDDDPDLKEKIREIDEILNKENERLAKLRKEKVLLLSDLNVSKIKKRFYRYDSPINVEDERVEKAKSELEDLKYENQALKDLDEKNKNS
ncbi:MAG: hypothetical protein HQK84_08130 [Nitrospinae bacterium]|nr:hypothetical protein [Nitrospinota bacterium]